MSRKRRKRVAVDGSLTVNGDLVLGDQFKNYRGAEGGAGIVIPVPQHGPATASERWEGGADATIGNHVYLLHARHLAEQFSADGSMVHREARALRRAPSPPRAQAYAWLRQVSRREDTPAARRALDALARERDLLVSLSGVAGIPQSPRFCAGPDDDTVTLTVTWPASRSRGNPCESLEEMVGTNGGPMSPARMYGLFSGLARLCGTLARLHRNEVAHRRLTPAGIIRLDSGQLVLRDLGLAAHDHESNEGPPDYRAPEQRWRDAGRPGPHTDAYQVAALVSHLLTGLPPDSRAPLPIGTQVLDLPEPLGRALDAALATNPAERLDVRALAEAFRGARKDLR